MPGTPAPRLPRLVGRADVPPVPAPAPLPEAPGRLRLDGRALLPARHGRALDARAPASTRRVTRRATGRAVPRTRRCRPRPVRAAPSGARARTTRRRRASTSAAPRATAADPASARRDRRSPQTIRVGASIRPVAAAGVSMISPASVSLQTRAGTFRLSPIIASSISAAPAQPAVSSTNSLTKTRSTGSRRCRDRTRRIRLPRACRAGSTERLSARGRAPVPR